MAYTSINFKTKKAFKEAVANGQRVTVYQPGPWGGPIDNGDVVIDGPQYPEPHRWYATAIVENGQVIKVK